MLAMLKVWLQKITITIITSVFRSHYIQYKYINSNQQSMKISYHLWGKAVNCLRRANDLAFLLKEEKTILPVHQTVEKCKLTLTRKVAPNKYSVKQYPNQILLK